MIDFTWKLFSQTGNIETYLLLKELEVNPNHADPIQDGKKEFTQLDSKM
ncbi:YqzL family protein [Virgibacillus oceani]|uniref:YqzL family protein n=1 Tax=Virgibacillus oceani TaxID=1479511 RepID=A0A917H0C8_9BACI|nr:YqzL family protein [Virgibacillus oceani]GGG63413.1 YqzL family protein [Virgibacillus oceani]